MKSEAFEYYKNFVVATADLSLPSVLKIFHENKSSHDVRKLPHCLNYAQHRLKRCQLDSKFRPEIRTKIPKLARQGNGVTMNISLMCHEGN